MDISIHSRDSTTHARERFLALRRAELQLQAGQFSQLSAESFGTISINWSEQNDSVMSWREFDQRALLGARLHLDDGEPDASIQTLRELDQRCQAQGRTRTRISALLLLAAAFHHKGQREAALGHARKALSIAASGLVLRPFLEERRIALPLLVHLNGSNILRGAPECEVDLISRIIRSSHRSASLGPALFSTRETEILQQLILGHNNKLIARAIGITPDTVRAVPSTRPSRAGAPRRRPERARRCLRASAAEDSGLLNFSASGRVRFFDRVRL